MKIKGIGEKIVAANRRARLAFERRRVRKYFDSIESRGGVVDGAAVLLVYNEQEPELSYILTEPF